MKYQLLPLILNFHRPHSSYKIKTTSTCSPQLTMASLLKCIWRGCSNSYKYFWFSKLKATTVFCVEPMWIVFVFLCYFVDILRAISYLLHSLRFLLQAENTFFLQAKNIFLNDMLVIDTGQTHVDWSKYNVCSMFSTHWKWILWDKPSI